MLGLTPLFDLCGDFWLVCGFIGLMQASYCPVRNQLTAVPWHQLAISQICLVVFDHQCACCAISLSILLAAGNAGEDVVTT
jgi:hypothetical protein